MLISELADAAGVKTSTVRFYERRGILGSPSRTPGGYRAYDADDVDRVRYLRRGQELGFTLAELGAMVALSGSREPFTAEITALGTAKLAEIADRIADLERVRAALAGLLEAQCADPDAPCPIVTALASGEASRQAV